MKLGKVPFPEGTVIHKDLAILKVSSVLNNEEAEKHQFGTCK